MSRLCIVCFGKGVIVENGGIKDVCVNCDGIGVFQSLSHGFANNKKKKIKKINGGDYGNEREEIEL